MEKPQKPSWEKYEDIPDFTKHDYKKVEASGERKEGYVKESAHRLDEKYKIVQGKIPQYYYSRDLETWGQKKELSMAWINGNIATDDTRRHGDIETEASAVNAERDELNKFFYAENNEADFWKSLNEIHNKTSSMSKEMYTEIASEAVAYHISKGNIEKATLINDNVPGISNEVAGPLNKTRLVEWLRGNEHISSPGWYPIPEEWKADSEVHEAALARFIEIIQPGYFFEGQQPQWVSFADSFGLTKDELVSSPEVRKAADQGVFEFLMRSAMYSRNITDKRDTAKYIVEYFGFPESLLRDIAAEVCKEILIHRGEKSAQRFAEHYNVSDEVVKSIVEEVQKAKEDGEAK